MKKLLLASVVSLGLWLAISGPASASVYFRSLSFVDAKHG
jgi:hypothetical protein